MAIDRTALADTLKLRALLRGADSDMLKSVSDYWGLNPEQELGGKYSVQDHADFLYPRMQAPQYFRPAFERLPATDKDLVYFLAIHGGEMSGTEIAKRSFRNNHASCRTAIENIATKGFVFFSEDLPSGMPGKGFWVSVPESYLRQLELPAHWHGFIGGLLRESDSETLQAVAGRVLGEEPGGVTSGPALRARIRQILTDPDQLRAYLEQLSELERLILQDIIDRKGLCLYRDLLDTTSPKKFDHSRAEQLNLLISTSGLVFVVNEGHNKYLNSLMVPRDIQHIVQHAFQADERSLQQIDSLSINSQDAAPSFILDNSQAVLRDLSILAGRIDSQRVKKLSGGGLSKTDLKRAATVFPASKPLKYASFLASFLAENGYLVEVNGEWRAADGFVDSLRDASNVFHQMWRWWMRTSDWNEIHPEGTLNPGEKPVPDLFNVLDLRRTLLREITAVARDRWVSFEAFWEIIQPRLETQLLKPATPGYPLQGANSLKDTTGAILAESLAWLGVAFFGSAAGEKPSSGAPAGRARGDGGRRGTTSKAGRADSRGGSQRFSFQLTPLGRNILERGLSENPGNETHWGEETTGFLAHGARWLIIQPNMEIVAPPDLALDAMFNLARFTEIRSMDVMTTMELSKESLRPCMERGANGDEIVSFLAELSRAELPETVRTMVDECTDRHGEVRVGTAGGYLTSSEPAVLEAVRHSPRLADFVKDALSDGTLVLAEQTDINKVARELRNLGLMPVLESGNVHSASDGRFHLSLNAQELNDLVAVVKLVRHMEEALQSDISEGSAATLAQRLSPESTTSFLGTDTGFEARAKMFQKRFEDVWRKVTTEISEKYKTQVSKLVTKSLSTRGTSRYHYKGPNPALERDDVMELLKFAMEFDLDVELLYVKQNDQETRVVVSPKGIEGERVYAHNPSTDSDGIYSVSRILKARML